MLRSTAMLTRLQDLIPTATVAAVLWTAALSGCSLSHPSKPQPAPGHHRFADAERWARRFEDPTRDAWQRPDYVLKVLHLQPDDVVADIGAATGYFPVRFARAVPQGTVYGLDVEPEMVEYLNNRAAAEALGNLHAVLTPPDRAALPEPVDAVFVCNTYHHITDRVAYFRQLRQHLRADARLMIVDYYRRPLPVGPPVAHKIAADEVIGELTAAGYHLVTHDETLDYQYILIFTAPTQT